MKGNRNPDIVAKSNPRELELKAPDASRGFQLSKLLYAISLVSDFITS